MAWAGAARGVRVTVADRPSATVAGVTSTVMSSSVMVVVRAAPPPALMAKASSGSSRLSLLMGSWTVALVPLTPKSTCAGLGAPVSAPGVAGDAPVPAMVMAAVCGSRTPRVTV
jgi:hypothetical protein